VAIIAPLNSPDLASKLRLGEFHFNIRKYFN
jgi:hypothetical protein